MTSAYLVSSVSSIPPVGCPDAQGPARPSVEQIGDAIADLAARLHAATYELLVLIRQFDASGGWSDAGARSCAHWLNWRIGLGLGAAREKVRVATALAELPLVSGAMQRGALSYSKVRALTRVATRENEARLVDLALSASAAQVERFARAWRRTDRQVAAEETAQRHLHRHLDVWVDDDGMVVRGRLSPEVGAVVQRALEGAVDRLFQESRQAVLEDAGGLYVSAETAQRLTCDASRVVMHHDADGAVLDVGRKTRTIPPAIRRALAARDYQCRFPVLLGPAPLWETP